MAQDDVARSSNQTKKEERKRTARDASKLNSEWNSVFAAGQERMRNVLANGTFYTSSHTQAHAHTRKHTVTEGTGGNGRHTPQMFVIKRQLCVSFFWQYSRGVGEIGWVRGRGR